MKISKLTGGLLVSLLLSASVAMAESKYPAADFQPKVVYQDSDYKHSGSSASSSSKKAGGEVSVADSNYPAANFEPKVVFEDTGYKHTKGKAVTASSSSSSSAQNVNVEQNSTDTTSEGDESSMGLILGLIAVAVAGLMFNKNQLFSNIKSVKKATPRRKARVQQAVASNTDGENASGVARYLETKVTTAPSGVEKYLEERVGTSTSGVAKYVAKQKISARLASVTGVEKYLKDRS